MIKAQISFPESVLSKSFSRVKRKRRLIPSHFLSWRKEVSDPHGWVCSFITGEEQVPKPQSKPPKISHSLAYWNTVLTHHLTCSWHRKSFKIQLTVNSPVTGSKPTWMVCSNWVGYDISGFFLLSTETNWTNRRRHILKRNLANINGFQTSYIQEKIHTFSLVRE